MLRPFFKPTRKDSLDGWKFSLDDDEGNVFLHGANPGTAQEHTPTLHPHLRLAETMIPYPTVEPGDTGKTDDEPMNWTKLIRMYKKFSGVLIPSTARKWKTPETSMLVCSTFPRFH